MIFLREYNNVILIPRHTKSLCPYAHIQHRDAGITPRETGLSTRTFLAIAEKNIAKHFFEGYFQNCHFYVDCTI